MELVVNLIKDMIKNIINLTKKEIKKMDLVREKLAFEKDGKIIGTQCYLILDTGFRIAISEREFIELLKDFKNKEIKKNENSK